jgi:hypothetical protein
VEIEEPGRPVEAVEGVERGARPGIDLQQVEIPVPDQEVRAVEADQPEVRGQAPDRLGQERVHPGRETGRPGQAAEAKILAKFTAMIAGAPLRAEAARTRLPSARNSAETERPVARRWK